MTYKFDSRFIGYPPIESVPLAAPAAGAFPAMTPGFLAAAEDPVWGPGEFIFARANGAIRQYGLCVLTPVWDGTNLTYTQNMTECPNTALLGRPVYVSQATGALASGQFGWFMTTGVSPVNGTVSVAADVAAGITAAGQIGTLAVSKQILNARVVKAGADTVVKAAVAGASGDNRIFVDNAQGWFVGAYLSGTGVGASTIITGIDPLNKFVTVSVANSAAVTGNVTATFNNATIFYNILAMNRPMAQGPIT